MTSSTQRSRLLTDARLFPVVGVVPYVLLGILAVYTVFVRHSDPVALFVDLALCVLAALWMLFWFSLHRSWWDRRSLMAVFVVGLIAILAVLVTQEAWFGFLAIAAYIFAFALVAWPWRLLAVAAIAVIAGSAQVSGVDKGTPFGVTTLVIVIAVNIVVMCGFCWIQWSTDQQSSEREQVLDEVSAANHRLEAMLTENAALYEQLVAQAREAGVQDERQRMAREIHDTLAQGLTGIITQLQAAEQSGENRSESRRHFEAAIALARESLSEARRSVEALRPEPLEGGRLGEAITDVAERWSAINSVEVQVTTTGSARPLQPEAEVVLLRAAQEALSNVARHAHASRVGVTLSYLDDQVALDVRDDGSGFEPARLGKLGEPRPSESAAPAAGGFGLIAMRQRVDGLAGSLQIESEPGAGTAISVSIPAASTNASAASTSATATSTRSSA